MNMLNNCTTERSATNASGALAALAEKAPDNLKSVAHALVTAISVRSSPARAVRLLAAFALLCNNGRTAQDGIAHEPGVIASLTSWLTTPSKDVQVQAALATLALASNNKTTQTMVGSQGGIPRRF